MLGLVLAVGIDPEEFPPDPPLRAAMRLAARSTITLPRKIEFFWSREALMADTTALLKGIDAQVLCAALPPTYCQLEAK